MYTNEFLPTVSDRRSLSHRVQRIAGVLLLLVGFMTLTWAFVVWRWNDPVTAFYTRWEQHQLAATLDRVVAEYGPRRTPPGASPAVVARRIAHDAALLRAEASQGTPMGRITVPRLGLKMLIVNGTDAASLKKGPGIDERTFVPGQGKLIYVAGHRTTYLAPFARIDALRPGDRVTLSMPYGTFDYSVTGHTIVDASDLSVLKSRGTEVVALQACHPRFFASQRYIVWAKPIAVTPTGTAKARPTPH